MREAEGTISEEEREEMETYRPLGNVLSILQASVPPRPPKKTRPPRSRLSQSRLAKMIEEATVDCYNESEQRMGLFTMIEENLAVPFETMILGVPVTVERIDLNHSEDVVAICRRGHERQSVPIIDLPLPTPPPPGAEWIEAYRRWLGGG